MESPPAKGLFAKAIAESGPMFGPMGTVEQAAQRGVERAKTWGASDLKELRAVPAEKFAGGALRDSQPVVDGKYVPEDVRAAFAAGHQAAVPLLIGDNSYEASLMAELHIQGDPANFMERGFLEPARFLAGRMEKAYLYYFSYVAERRRAGSKGVPHGGEIPYVFDHPGPMATSADLKMAHTVSAYWVNFAKTGNPNGSGLKEWPPYQVSTGRLLELGPEIVAR
jgi:para-nitrobenzyl esterase